MSDSNVIEFPGQHRPRVAASIDEATAAKPSAAHELSEAEREVLLAAVLRGIAALGPAYRLSVAWPS